MRRLLILSVLLFVGCDETITIDLGNWNSTAPSIFRQDYDYPDYAVERPTVNLETIYREENWIAPGREGSCVHATLVMLLRWQGQFKLADYWRANYYDGEWAEQFAAKMDKAGIKYAYTSGENDVSFLEWACATRRGCGVAIKGGKHMVMLVYLDGEYACTLDNNFPENFKWVSRETFITDWLSSNSWAVTPVMSAPPPPLPYDY